MLILQALTYIERYDQTSGTIWNYVAGTLTSSKGSDKMLNWIMLSNLNCGEVCTHANYKQPEHGKASSTKEQKCSSFQANYD